MDTFRTQFPIEIKSFGLHHQQRSMVIGSCFAEHIGERLQQRRFHTLVNPFGIVFNPASILGQLRWLMARDSRLVSLYELNGLWHSFDHHGRFSGLDRTSTLDRINAALDTASAHLSQLDRLMVTFGTAEVFIHNETKHVVANCHKFPANTFTRQRLSVDEIVAPWSEALQQLHRQNPEIQVLLTVSPVRHTRSGMVENQRSKATLVLACHELCDRLPFVQYFPAYELLIDDLRDYRFYASDMVHPSDTAVDYVWQHFVRTCIRPDAVELSVALEKINRALAHRPFNPDTPQHQAFLAQQQQALATLEEQYPFLKDRPLVV